MSSPSPEPDPTKDNGKSFTGLSWLLLGFVPCVAALIGIQFTLDFGVLLPILITVNFFCSITASIGLVLSLKKKAISGIVGLGLAVFFFVANIAIVVLVGCSSIGNFRP